MNLSRRQSLVAAVVTVMLIAVLLATDAGPYRSEAVQSLAFAGLTWQQVGPCTSTGDVLRPGMSATEYSAGESDVRLIELVASDDSTVEQMYSRLLRVQVYANGTWITHGPAHSWLQDGSRSEIDHVRGLPHGAQREWYANGQPRLEIEWANGMKSGRARGWYRNGIPLYDVVYIDDHEVEGRAWREDGTLRQDE